MEKGYKISDWEKLFQESELDDNIVKENLIYVRRAFENNVPVIIDLRHLAALLGLKAGVVTNMIRKPKSFYRQFEIPKKSGGKREIVTPHKSLLEVQRWIVKHIFSSFEVHPSAFAYRPNRNVILNAREHIGAKEMFKIDIQNFFPSINIARVRELFNRKGYSKEVAGYLSSLCCLNGSIPQGAATSPIISNIILLNLDKRMFSFANKYNITYSRYADDLVFSGDILYEDFMQLVEKNIMDEGFKINESKTRYYEESHRKMVNGLIIKQDRIRLPKYKRRIIRHEVHCIIKYGIINQIKRSNDIFVVERILGRLGYWKQIEPQNE